MIQRQEELQESTGLRSGEFCAGKCAKQVRPADVRPGAPQLYWDALRPTHTQNCVCLYAAQISPCSLLKDDQRNRGKPFPI